MAKPNYSFEKRQRDLAKKRKKEEKRERKKGTQSEQPAVGTPASSGDGTPVACAVRIDTGIESRAGVRTAALS